MKTEQEVRKCDFCSKESVFVKGVMGGFYFPGWITVSVMSINGPGGHSTGDYGNKDFCCINHAIKHLEAFQLEKNREKNNAI